VPDAARTSVILHLVLMGWRPHWRGRYAALREEIEGRMQCIPEDKKFLDDGTDLTKIVHGSGGA
jgi:hypothetical protein